MPKALWRAKFQEMAPTGKGGAPSDKLAKAIDESFGSLDDFKATERCIGLGLMTHCESPAVE